MNTIFYSPSIHKTRNECFNIISTSRDLNLRKESAKVILLDTIDRMKKAIYYSGNPCINGCSNCCTRNGPHGPNTQHKVAIWVNKKHLINYSLFPTEFTEEIELIDEVMAEIDEEIHKIRPARWCGNPSCHQCITSNVIMEKQFLFKQVDKTQDMVC